MWWQLQEVQYLITTISFSRRWVRFRFQTLIQISLNLRSTEWRRQQFILDESQKLDKSFRWSGLCCWWLAATDFRTGKTSTVQSSFFWTLNPWPSLETMQTHRDSLTVQGGAFTSSCWLGSGRSQGRITAAPCAPSLLPTFLSCGDLRLTFLHLFAAIKNRQKERWDDVQIQQWGIENVIFPLVAVSSHILTGLRMDRCLVLSMAVSSTSSSSVPAGCLG